MRRAANLFLIYLMVFPLFADAAMAQQGQNSAALPFFAEQSLAQPVGMQEGATLAPQIADVSYISFAEETISPSAPAKDAGTANPANPAQITTSEGEVKDPRTLVETPLDSAARQNTTNPQRGINASVPQVNRYVCDSSNLAPNETQNVLDLLKKGFTGKEIGSGQNPNQQGSDTTPATNVIGANDVGISSLSAVGIIKTSEDKRPLTTSGSSPGALVQNTSEQSTEGGQTVTLGANAIARVKNTNPGKVDATVSIKLSKQSGGDISCPKGVQRISLSAGDEVAVGCDFTNLVAGYYTAKAELKPSITCANCSDDTATNSLSKTFYTGITEREKLANDTVILTNPDDPKVAVKGNVPGEKFSPWEISQFLNTSIKGPFSFGVVLTDTLRTGRCETFSSQDCALSGPNLKFRNSGVGIVADLRPIKEIFTETDAKELTQQEHDQLKQAIVASQNSAAGEKDSEIKTAERLESKLLTNSILTDFFEAKLETNCNNSNCVISTYSLFDKFFNSWSSSEMVVSSFGPSLIFQTKKLFGWTGRRGFFTGVRESTQDFLDRFRAEYISPHSLLGKALSKRINNRLDQYGWRGWWEETVGGSSNGTGYYLFKTEEFQHHWGKALEPDGFLSHIKTQEERAEFLRMLYDMRSFVRAGHARLEVSKAAWKDAQAAATSRAQAANITDFNPASDPVVRQKYLEFGQEMVRYMDDTLDEGLGADYIEWVTRYPAVGLYDKGVNFIRADGTTEVVNLMQDHRVTQRMLEYFKENGSFNGLEKNFLRGEAIETKNGNIMLYNFDPGSQKQVAGLSYSNVKAAAGNKSNVFIQDQYGNYVPYNNVSYEFIQNRLSANANIVEGRWKSYGELTPESMISRIDNGRTGSSANMRFPALNIQQMIDTLQAKNWVSRRYWNALDKFAAQEDELIRNYFTIKGGAKWTALPFGYWWGKKGFGVEGLSQYQLPDTWSTLSFTIGPENVYDYAFIDFFANEGSDQGDLFIQVINKLPWKLILDEVSEKYNPVKNLYNTLTKNELRSETENLAFYFTGPSECDNCQMTLKSTNLQDFSPFFFVPDDPTVSYILEDTVSEDAREKGQTLILYASHTNLEGKSGRETGEPINLVKAIEDEKTCADALKSLNFAGFTPSEYLPEPLYKKLTEKGRVGVIIGGLQSVSYATFFWAGIFSTAAMQIVVAPQLHECVDVDEGYYAHYFVPAKEKTNASDASAKSTNPAEKSTEKVSALVQSFKEKFVDGFKGSDNSFTKDSAENLGGQIDKFVSDSKTNNIVEATLRTRGLSSGQLISRELFYFWCGRGCELRPSSYKEEGAQQVRGVNGLDVGIDYEDGKITVNGTPIVENPDNVRMTTTNGAIPGLEIPQRMTKVCLENSNERVLEIAANGEVRVLNRLLLDCIQGGIMQQTGLPLLTDKLNDAFGKFDSLVTDTHPNVQVFGDKIIAEGVPRKLSGGRDSTIVVYADKSVELSGSNDGFNDIGSLQSIQFANGTIVVKPDGCLLVWLRHHEGGILSKEMVEGLRPSITREPNAETGCDDPALNLQLLSDPSSDFKTAKVATFNTALSHQGPFTVFDTPTKRYVISAEKDANGVCQDHLRVIDKETGAVTDYVGKISGTPNGLKITTPDGQTHELKFSTKDGAPFVQFNDDKPEPLSSAQGKNGSFYYDPDKGLWYAENAQLLPLLEAFRDGIAAKVGPNGEVTATASGNQLTLNLGDKDDSSLLNLPSLPETRVALLIFAVLLVVSFIYVQRKGRK